jgi:hypothetical protein
VPVFDGLTDDLEEVSKLQRMVDMFRCLAKGVDAPTDERDWAANVSAGAATRNHYMCATVRREVRTLQFQLTDISHTKIEEILHALGENNSKPRFDREISAMYI